MLNLFIYNILRYCIIHLNTYSSQLYRLIASLAINASITIYFACSHVVVTYTCVYHAVDRFLLINLRPVWPVMRLCIGTYLIRLTVNPPCLGRSNKTLYSSIILILISLWYKNCFIFFTICSAYLRKSYIP